MSSNRNRSASRGDIRSKRANSDMPKRDSIYQSSKEVNLLNRTESVVRREKIELSRESASTLFPFGIIDSLCGPDEDRLFSESNRSSVMSTSGESTSSYSKKKHTELHACDSLNYSFSSKSEKQSFSNNNNNNNNKSVRDVMISCKRLHEISPAVNLHEPLSAKLALPHSPALSESGVSKTKSPKAVSSPARKKFGPFVKSRSHRSPLMKAFSDNHKSVSLSSPAHLNGILKTESKNGLLSFEFSLKSRDDVYHVAKTWKADNALTWMYTFHSLGHKRKSNTSGWGFNDKSRESTMIGQMVISCYLCTEITGAGAFNDSMVTEYVLYDTAQSRRSTSSQDDSSCSADTTKTPLATDYEQNKVSAKKMNTCRIIKHSQPLAVAELHPELETAAIVMQVPFGKRESLKFKSGDSEMDNLLPNLLDLYRLEEVREGISDSSGSGKMHVVIPAGNHSSPSSEYRYGPSPILDRWRLGGGCECGGWDMACPLDVFVNPDFRISEGHPLMDNRHPVELFVQGRKENNTAAFTMRAIEEGKYAVDFHARLSSLQAFSICVAILHAAEASATVGHEKSKRIWQSDSLRVFAEEEIENLIGALSKEEKLKANKKNEEILPSFVINPPFSPIARA
ncbi:hypothetical protein OROMI_020470 [Orobanche minor]